MPLQFLEPLDLRPDGREASLTHQDGPLPIHLWSEVIVSGRSPQTDYSQQCSSLALALIQPLTPLQPTETPPGGPRESLPEEARIVQVPECLGGGGQALDRRLEAKLAAREPREHIELFPRACRMSTVSGFWCGMSSLICLFSLLKILFS